jgi:hypothetical protein
MSTILVLFSAAFVFKVLGVVKRGIVKGMWESIEMVGRVIGWVLGIVVLIVSLITALIMYIC